MKWGEVYADSVQDHDSSFSLRTWCFKRDGLFRRPVEPIETDTKTVQVGRRTKQVKVSWPEAADVMAQDYALIIDTWLKTAEDEDDEPKEWRAQFRGRAVRVIDEAGAKLVRDALPGGAA